MLVQIVGFNGTASFMPCEAKALVAGQFYMTGEIKQDDEGEETGDCDLVHVTADTVPGSPKVVRLVRFLKTGKLRRLSELPGVKFFGPVMMQFHNNKANKNEPTGEGDEDN